MAAEENSSTGTFTGRVDLAWRYAEDGRIIAYAGFARDAQAYGNFQHDYRYDEHGNIVDFRLSYPDAPDLMVPSPAPTWLGTSYQNEYDGTRLASSTLATYGDGGGSSAPLHKTFFEDTAGRCVRIETNPVGAATTFIETRSYDGDRVVRADVTNLVSSNGFPCASTITINTYDDRGRITNESTWCAPDITGQPAYSETTSYGADGSQRIELFDYVNDTPNEVITRSDGTQQSVTHVITTRSAECAVIDDAIGTPSGAGCRPR